MKLNSADFPRLRSSLLAFLLMAFTGGAVVSYALMQNSRAQTERLVATQQRNQFDNKLKQVRNEESDIREKSNQYSSLLARGIIGEEQRLEWSELLKEIFDKHHLVDLNYEISPQHRLDTGGNALPDFYASSMRMQFQPLHEEEFIRVLKELRGRAKAHIQIRNCKLNRLTRDSLPTASLARLQADCQINWITVRQAPGK